jgi:starch-binding outer membrane protein, SusD/RagB family
MKNKYFKISLLAVLFSAISCQDFLKREPLDQITEDNFYLTESDVDKGLMAAYSPMQDIEWCGKEWMLTEIPSDNSAPGGTDPDFTPIDKFTLSADNTPVANYWAIHYRQITLANIVIAKINAMTTLEEAKKKTFLSEAMFLRAVAYFDLVRIYGAVPLIADPPIYGNDLFFPRSPVEEVYQMIITDFQFATEHLPSAWSGGSIGRATSGAAWAFLSKVHLTRREYVKARDAAKNVIATGTYALMPSFGDNFELETSDNNMESIFQVQLTGCGPFGTGNARQAFFAPWGEGITKDRDGWGSQIPTGPALNNPNTTIVDAFEDDDLRKYFTVMTPGKVYPTINPNDGGYRYPTQGASASAANIKKYVVGSGSNICFMSTPQNVHVIRYSDVLLTYAESIMEIKGGTTTDAEALDAFNQVRSRAGLQPLTEITRDLILQERRVEFAFEGQRWFDLLRSGKAIDILALHGKNVNVFNLLFPIPSGELAVNPKMQQNPGY